MPKFNFEKIVNSSNQKIYELFTNYENYQKILPDYFPSVRVLSTRNNVSVVEEHMMLGDKELVMMTKHILEAPLKHEIFVIGGDAKGTHIIETFENISQGTKLKVVADFKIKGKMLVSDLLGKNKIEKEYSEIINAFLKTRKI